PNDGTRRLGGPHSYKVLAASSYKNENGCCRGDRQRAPSAASGFSDQSLLRKGPAGMRLQILFKFQCLVLVVEGAIPDECPRHEFRRMCRFARIVIGQTLLQICRCADVFLIGKHLTADDVYVPHEPAPVRLRFRCAQATPDTLRPAGSTWLR